MLTPSQKLGLPFVPVSVGSDFLEWPKLPDLLPANFPGVKTSRDDFLVAPDLATIEERIRSYFDPEMPNDEMLKRYPGIMESTARFNATDVRKTLLKRGRTTETIVRFCYRPFDVRWLYWEPETKLLDEKRSEYFRQVSDGNKWLSAGQKNRKEEFYQPQVVSVLADHHIVESNVAMFPLLIRDEAILGGTPGEPRPNLSPVALKYLASLPPDIDGQPVPTDSLFFHAVATLHSPAYRAENAGALRQDWPRIPLPADRDALLASAALGRRVAVLLDPETPVPGITSGTVETHLRRVAVLQAVGDANAALDPATDLAITAGWGHFGQGGSIMPGRGKATGYNDLDSGGPKEDTDGTPLRTGPDFFRVHLNARACWDAVPRAIWEYTLGGYQVLKKWLSYREESVLGRPLRPEEAREFTAIARRVAALLALGPDLDASYRTAADHVVQP